MNGENNHRIEEARASLQKWRRLRAELPTAREQHARQTAELQQIEAGIVDIEQQLHTLQSFSLTSIIESISGQKQRKIDEHRAHLSELETEFQTVQPAVESLAAQIVEMQDELVSLDGAEDGYRAACDEKAQAIVARGDAGAERLAELSAQVDSTRAALRSAQKAQETGRQLLKHLESLDRAVRNARSNRRMSAAAGGAVGGIIKGAVASMGPKSAIRYVDDGLKRFCRELTELPLGDHPDDTDLMRLQAELGAFQVRLSTELSGVMTWDEITTLPVQTGVQAAVSHLKAMVNDLARELAAAEEERRALIESA